MFFVRKAVQAACDLGALAGVQELDWDLLAAGTTRMPFLGTIPGVGSGFTDRRVSEASVVKRVKW